LEWVRVKGGVFLHKEVPKTQLQAHIVRTYDLWHGRLGHPSEQVLSSVAKSLDIGDGSKVNESCDICFRAKQT